MVSRRFLAAVSLITTAAVFFLLGVFQERSGGARERASYDAKLDAIRAEVRGELGPSHDDLTPAGEQLCHDFIPIRNAELFEPSEGFLDLRGVETVGQGLNGTGAL